MNGSGDTGRPPPMKPPMAPPPLATRPSRAAHTLGVLSLIFGGLAALNGLWQILGALAGPGLSAFWKRLPGGAGERASEAYRTMASAGWAQATQGLILLVLSIALIPIGLGQLRFRRWATRASLVWGASALVALAVIVVLQATVVAPAMRETMARMTEGPAGGGQGRPEIFEALGSLATVASLAGTVIFYAPWPVVLLVLFRRPRVIASMSA